MPTPTGLPKVGEYLRFPDGVRAKVLERTTNDRHCSVRVEWPKDPRGWKYLTEVMYWIENRGWKIES